MEEEEDDPIIDVYSEDNELVDDDSITPEEEGFMQGYIEASKKEEGE